MGEEPQVQVLLSMGPVAVLRLGAHHELVHRAVQSGLHQCPEGGLREESARCGQQPPG